MKKSGHNQNQRMEVLISGLRGYKRMERDVESGKRPINRPEWMGVRGRRLKRLIGNKTWFKMKKGKRKVGNKWKKKNKVLGGKLEDREVETVMVVPYTNCSKLQKEIQEADDNFVMGGTGKRLRIVERGGQSLEQILGRNDPWGGHGCTRTDCMQCQHGGGEGGECQGENVLYKISCLKRK